MSMCKLSEKSPAMCGFYGANPKGAVCAGGASAWPDCPYREDAPQNNKESQTTDAQQLKAAIVRSCPECQLPEPTIMCDCFNFSAEKL